MPTSSCWEIRTLRCMSRFGRRFWHHAARLVCSFRSMGAFQPCRLTSTESASRSPQEIFRKSRIVRARTVIIGLNWWHAAGDLVDPSGRTVDNTNDRALMSALDDLIDRLHHDGKQVVLTGPVAEPGWDIASILSRELAFGHQLNRLTYLPASDFERRFGSLIRHFEARNDIDFARPDKVQCPADRCYYVMDGHSLFSDSNHLGIAELPWFGAVFEAGIPQKG